VAPLAGLATADSERLAALRAGDERAFAELVDELSPEMLRLARVHVSTHAAAEEVVQEAWLGVVRGLERFEGRAALKTWIFRILVNVAKSRGVRDARSTAFSSIFEGAEGDEAALEPERFLPAGHARWPRHWAIGPTPWPEQALANAELLRVIRATVDRLPASQREVITLRDIVGCSAEETCNALDLSDTNQRVLLHRARAKVRAALERELDAMEPTV
jgi:RNA polymerase sigma-70 factor (ECF subfamily)